VEFPGVGDIEDCKNVAASAVIWKMLVTVAELFQEVTNLRIELVALGGAGVESAPEVACGKEGQFHRIDD
jgi:hypothetical protein